VTLPARRPGLRLGAAGRLSSTDLFCLVLLVAVAARFIFSDELSTRSVSAWSTVFAAICIQASPFVALGVLVSTVIAVGTSDRVFARLLPRRAGLAVPVAGLCGVLLPGCECGSVPVAASLMRKGVSGAPAVTFLLSGPAVNPVVLVATSVAFPGHPAVVLARFLASLATSMLVGWMWIRLGRGIEPPRRLPFDEHDSIWTRARLTASHDLARSLGLLSVGAAAAASVKVAVPTHWLERLGGNEVGGIEVGGIVVLGLLAIALAICSEADAFIAASLTQFSLSARLVFMVVGPAVDLKLIAMQVGTFGSSFTRRFAPLTFVVAVLTASGVGLVLL
jgi:uncharacterized membrane protein YraQ (UPF0718 family)